MSGRAKYMLFIYTRHSQPFHISIQARMKLMCAICWFGHILRLFLNRLKNFIESESEEKKLAINNSEKVNETGFDFYVEYALGWCKML